MLCTEYSDTSKTTSEFIDQVFELRELYSGCTYSNDNPIFKIVVVILSGRPPIGCVFSSMQRFTASDLRAIHQSNGEGIRWPQMLSNGKKAYKFRRTSIQVTGSKTGGQRQHPCSESFLLHRGGRGWFCLWPCTSIPDTATANSVQVLHDAEVMRNDIEVWTEFSPRYKALG